MCKKIYFLFASVLLLIELANSQTIVQENRPIVSYDCDPVSSTVVTDLTIGPCYDIGCCQMPDCCGIISGTLTNISLTYTASVPMTTATTHGYLVGVAVGCSQNKLLVPIPITQVPNAVVTYDYDSCHYTPCPQEVGNVYRFDGMFTVPTTAVTTANLFANFVAQLTSDEPGNPVVVCKQIFARIVNVNLLPSLIDIIKNPVLGIGK